MTRAMLEIWGLGPARREVFGSAVLSLCWVRTSHIGSRERTRVGGGYAVEFPLYAQEQLSTLAVVQFHHI